MSRHALSLLSAALLAAAAPAQAQSVSPATFVNGLALSGSATDMTGTGFDSRIGYFSDIYYDRGRNEWWALSDRGPGGGTLTYDTRIQRFTLDVAANGAISNFKVVQTIKFTNAAGVALNGLAPSPSGMLGNSFDPEGMVINPKNGHILVSDEYGPSVYEFNRSGTLVKAYTVPDNLVPKVNGTVNYNANPITLTSGREGNRGLEGLAISPDGNFAYAMLQDGTVADGELVTTNTGTSLTRSTYTRIVKYNTSTGQAVGQYAYQLDSIGQGRGISAIVALGNDKFMVLERNNRGIGSDPTTSVGSPDKNVFMIDLAGATDVSGIDLPLTGNLPTGFSAVTKGAKVIDLDANTLAALGNKSPEKWEGLAIGPQLANGQYLILAGTDNDYSVTQNGSNVQFDVWFDMALANPNANSIQCPVGSTSGCFFSAGGAAASLTSDYTLAPGVLHAYTANVSGYIAPVPEPTTWALMLGGLAAVGALSRRRAARAAA